MEQVLEKRKCMGCSACMNICPVGAIEMHEDKEGFKRPVINQEKCINCGACRRTCPVLNTQTNQALNKCYACYSKDEHSMANSSSGGIFYLLADYVIKNKGIVIGAAFDKHNKLNHIAINELEDIIHLQGSKYLQSDLRDIFQLIRKNIKDKLILFVGTPCQVAGLKAFLKKDYDNLITVDIICHGVPSPKLFKKYVTEMEARENQKLVKYIFRDKTSGWETYSNTFVFEKGQKTQLASENNYMKLFLSDIALRESCYDCHFKLGNKYSDLTLGDFWGVEKIKPQLYNKSGVSAVILNSNKGIDLFKSIEKDLIYEECRLEEILTRNKSLESSSRQPKNRNQFFGELETKSIKKLTNIYCYKNFMDRFIKNVKKEVKKMIK